MDGEMMQLALEIEPDAAALPHLVNSRRAVRPFKKQLLKWIGNKQRLAHEIISFFPEQFGTYYEPFLGSAGVLGVLAPQKAEASDSFEPLIALWNELKERPQNLKKWYADRWGFVAGGVKADKYEEVKAKYNQGPNPADLLFLSRSCYGGVVRFRMKDGYMSTPCGVHAPISPEAFAIRVDQWHERVRGTSFFHRDYEEAIERAREGDVVYCDPPYTYSQAILYGAQGFSLEGLVRSIERAKTRGVFVALSIDGSKKSGTQQCAFNFPMKLFAREVNVRLGRSMLKRFQMEGKTLESEVVTDRLLLTH